MDARVNDDFGMAAGNGSVYPHSFDKAYDLLVRRIVQATRKQSLDAAEPEVRLAFKSFMQSQNYHLAALNFDKLLDEKSGSKFLRNDGTTNWYHEFLPIMAFVHLVHVGKKQGGIDLADLEPYGGLETAIITHLRHDSVEDQPEYKQNETIFRAEQLDMLHSISKARLKYDIERGYDIIEQTLMNISLITQKKEIHPDGSSTKESVRAYTKRMVSSLNANPVVFMLKQADGIHNFATMWAPKFTPDRRQKRCDEREDMYGPRNGYTDAAMEKWPDFKKGMKVFDSMMGTMLYTHFRYLESVDLHYKEPDDFPVGIARYLGKTLRMGLPEPLNMVHIFMKNLMTSVDPATDPEKYARLQTFLEDNVRPPFAKYKNKFPYLFGNEGHQRHFGGGRPPSPVAM